MALQADIEALYDADPATIDRAEALKKFSEFKFFLNRGEIRAAEKSGEGWTVNHWVKKGILLGFRLGALQDVSIDSRFRFFDRSTYPLKNLTAGDGVRLVPGGSSIRDGAFVARGVVCMPPMYINTGAYVDAGTMVDSHALVGSCAQIGKRVHISAAAQIGGVLFALTPRLLRRCARRFPAAGAFGLVGGQNAEDARRPGYSYSSALAKELQLTSAPPAISTFPLGNIVEAWNILVTLRLAVVANVPITGLYSSALANTPPTPFPPVTNTFPLDNKVAVWPTLPTVMPPVTVNVPAPGSYSSALERTTVPPLDPPATSTMELGSDVAVWEYLATVMLPVAAKVPAPGS